MIKCLNIMKVLPIATMLVAQPVMGNANTSLSTLQKDVFASSNVSAKVLPQGTDNISVLKSAPSCKVVVNGKTKLAKFVIDITKNILYTYNDNGKVNFAYSIASGKASTPTHTGVRIVSHTENYPYKNAPKLCKRRKHPKAYGPHAIILDVLNTKTGEDMGSNGEFIHGTNNPSSIGKHISHGCMRLDNEVITKLYKMVKRGDIVLIQK